MTYIKDLDGWINYADLATQTVQLNYVSGDLALSNDGAWSQSEDGFAPAGITALRNTTTSQFDFSWLKVGDEVTIRTSISITTTGVWQVVKLNYTFDIWGSPYDLTIDNLYFKTAWSYNLVDTERFYIWSVWMVNNPWEVRFNSDAAADITVNWFFISVKRK